jgi:hypothetical protein
MPRRLLLALAALFLYALHQDVWNWRTPRPLVFGVVPIGLAYHAMFSVAASLLLALFVRFAWPAELEREAEEADARAEGERRG